MKVTENSGEGNLEMEIHGNGNSPETGSYIQMEKQEDPPQSDIMKVTENSGEGKLEIESHENGNSPEIENDIRTEKQEGINKPPPVKSNLSNLSESEMVREKINLEKANIDNSTTSDKDNEFGPKPYKIHKKEIALVHET